MSKLIKPIVSGSGVIASSAVIGPKGLTVRNLAWGGAQAGLSFLVHALYDEAKDILPQEVEVFGDPIAVAAISSALKLMVLNEGESVLYVVLTALISELGGEAVQTLYDTFFGEIDPNKSNSIFKNLKVPPTGTGYQADKRK
jgi:hypothetical protein